MAHVPTPDLRVVPLANIHPHEAHDHQRALPLVDALRRDGHLRNPVLAADLPGRPHHYILLDGTNRLAACRMMRLPHMLVQVVPYEPPQVVVDTWNHTISKADPTEVLRAIRSLCDDEDIHLSDTAADEMPKSAVVPLLTAALDDGRYTLTAADTAPTLRVMALLREFTAALLEVGRLNRTTVENFREAQQLYPDLTAFITYRPISPETISALVAAGEYAPAGVTRHIIQGRALYVDYPINDLMVAEPLELKNQRLQSWLRDKFAGREVRLYTEATYLFET